MDLRHLSDDVEKVSERYAKVFGIRRDDTWFLLKLQEEVGELTQAFLMRAGQARDKGRSPADLHAAFAAEIADVVCHALLLARHFEVDVAAEIDRKWLSRLR
ncbi:pyrophosphatase [Nucisporomicrobium flavum]|uniref:pyrophosphatase n=1 Tax=Nucisporomicrobium flavum TaxID=2785915 RepID=UPI0018F2E8A2|nr:pyrophosphatase [Nucisporomicrobium flavum]